MKPKQVKITRTESKFSQAERHEMYLNATDKYENIQNNMGLCQAINESNEKKYEQEIFYSRKVDFPEFELFKSSDNMKTLGGYFWSFLQEDLDARLLGLAFMIAISDEDDGVSDDVNDGANNNDQNE